MGSDKWHPSLKTDKQFSSITENVADEFSSVPINGTLSSRPSAAVSDNNSLSAASSFHDRSILEPQNIMPRSQIDHLELAASQNAFGDLFESADDDDSETVGDLHHLTREPLPSDPWYPYPNEVMMKLDNIFNTKPFFSKRQQEATLHYLKDCGVPDIPTMYEYTRFKKANESWKKKREIVEEERGMPKGKRDDSTNYPRKRSKVEDE